MPTYDYECDACGHSFDAFQNMSDDPLKECPSCGKNKLRRLIGGGLGVIFKGSGFYSTDARGGGTTKKSAETSESSATGESSDATSTPESKKESTGADSGKSSDKSGKKKESASVAG
ncbi:MAG: FmdB family zinc ribbon protein [Spirochaetales bacterium]